MTTNHLQAATVRQLLEWQRAIVDELGIRAARAQPAAPPPPQPPWEQMGMAEPRPQPRNRDLSVSINALHDNEQRSEIEMLRAQLAEARASVQPSAPVRAPSMLGGQQAIGPGMVIATQRTDPELAAIYGATPLRQDGVPGVQGNGRLTGEVTFG